MTSEEKLKIAIAVAQHLQGTCATLYGVLTDQGHRDAELENDLEFCNSLDSLVFCCDECSWWVEVGEGDGECCDECLSFNGDGYDGE